MRIKVSQQHIDAGTPGDPLNCPIGLAIQDVNPGLRFVSTPEANAPAPSPLQSTLRIVSANRHYFEKTFAF